MHEPVKHDKVFDLFFSKDLINWEKLDPLLKVPDYGGGPENFYWAPEILPYKDKFYLHYTGDTNGDDYQRFVRVGVSDRIQGPYEDCGTRLTAQTSIDGHVLRVSDDEMYMLYTGNEGNVNMGQLMIERMISPTELSGEPQKVFPDETVEWEEGAFTIHENARYFLFTSTGNWRNGTYHIRVAVSEKPQGPYKRLLNGSDPFVLLSTTGELNGPGHCSLFRDTDQRIYICFHAWDNEHTGRYPWLNPVIFKENCPLVQL
jgi:beta-xylosidase